MKAENNLVVNSAVGSDIKRNQGIDLLRLISTILIVSLHVLSQGGILKAAGNFTIKGEILWLFQTLCFGGVNTFALISGYVGLRAKHKPSNLILLWIQVVFYTVLSALIINIFFAENFSVVSIIKGFFPIYTEENWYFSAYFVVFLFMPLLNQIVEKVEKNILERSLLSAVAVFMVLATLKNISVLGVNAGYSVVWIALMYLLGAYIKEYDPLKNLSSRACALGVMCCVLITFASRLAIEFATFKIIGVPSYGTKFMTYTSPIMVLQAVFSLELFSNLSLRKELPKFIRWFVPMSFGVFIIHTTTVFYSCVLREKFAFVADFPLVVVIAVSLFIIISIFVACSIIDFGRICLFKFCGINKLAKFLSEKIESVFTKIKNF